MSDKSRLESAEKLLVAHHRMFQEITKALTEVEQEFEQLHNQIENLQHLLEDLQDEVDSRKSGNEGKQFLKCPNS